MDTHKTTAPGEKPADWRESSRRERGQLGDTRGHITIFYYDGLRFGVQNLDSKMESKAKWCFWSRRAFQRRFPPMRRLTEILRYHAQQDAVRLSQY